MPPVDFERFISLYRCHIKKFFRAWTILQYRINNNAALLVGVGQYYLYLKSFFKEKGKTDSSLAQNDVRDITKKAPSIPG